MRQIFESISLTGHIEKTTESNVIRNATNVNTLSFLFHIKDINIATSQFDAGNEKSHYARDPNQKSANKVTLLPVCWQKTGERESGEMHKTKQESGEIILIKS